MVTAADPVLLRGPQFLDAGAEPLLLERTDARFMGNVRDELAAAERHAELRGTIVKENDATLRLYQPVHRTYHIALAEAVCDAPGKPRLDPAKIESAGMVIRRVEKRVGGRRVPVHEGWMQSREGGARWVAFADSPFEPSGLSKDADPDAQRRRSPSTGNAELDRRLALGRPTLASWSESASELFVLPPPVAAATRSTLLFGLVTTTSLAVSPAPPAPEFEDDDILNASYPVFLQAGDSSLNVKLPSIDRVVPRPERDRPETLRTDDKVFQDYVSFLQQMVIQYDLLGESPAAKKLRAELNRIQLPFPSLGEKATKPLGVHLEEAAKVLVLGPDEGAASFRMPGAWVRPNRDQARAILDAIKDSTRQRLDGLAREESQFASPDDRYRLRAFVRVRRPDGCPPALFWSKETRPFSIAPWFENGPAPMPVVQLPDPFAPGGLGRFKPNVAFAVPPSIADVIRSNSPDDLIKGQGSKGPSLGIAWLCGFNIPLITLCAFIVLSIFLSLFQIIFWWLAFIKICIPIPRKQP